MQVALDSMSVIKKMAEIGNPNSITDACVAALCARTAVRGAFLNVQINCLDYNDKSFVDDINKKGENILEKAFKLENKIISITEKNYEEIKLIISFEIVIDEGFSVFKIFLTSS